VTAIVVPTFVVTVANFLVLAVTPLGTLPIVVIVPVLGAILVHFIVVAPLMPTVAVVPIPILIAHGDIAEIQVDGNARYAGCACHGQTGTSQTDRNNSGVNNFLHFFLENADDAGAFR
tara:strand:+ start:1306 stop:1659 length:354 start_codon:yes stop_codon:yes gene_type:complete